MWRGHCGGTGLDSGPVLLLGSGVEGVGGVGGGLRGCVWGCVSVSCSGISRQLPVFSRGIVSLTPNRRICYGRLASVLTPYIDVCAVRNGHSASMPRATQRAGYYAPSVEVGGTGVPPHPTPTHCQCVRQTGQCLFRHIGNGCTVDGSRVCSRSIATELTSASPLICSRIRRPPRDLYPPRSTNPLSDGSFFILTPTQLGPVHIPLGLIVLLAVRRDI